VSVGEQIESLERETLVRVPTLASADELEQLRVEVIGRKGALTGILRGLKDATPAERPVLGDRANAAKRAIESAINTALSELRHAAEATRIQAERVDVTLPAGRWPVGHFHPLQQAMTDAIGILESMGFEVADGPEMEDDEHNFEALNFAPDHPARDMADTFLLEDGRLLRTHTSPIQIRVMRERQPPLAVIAPGATYRRDDDATHLPMFHQIESFLVDSNIRFSDLKGVLEEFLVAFFGKVELRFRASYFPFVEPGAEVDIACVMCAGAGSGCRVCSSTGWLEILGAGMIHPNVLRAVNYDPERVSGFAFGVGVERLAMLRHAIDDMRLLVENDLRFLGQF
jgi:phenylalanyl-tRNA synthetase alpha chain